MNDNWTPIPPIAATALRTSHVGLHTRGKLYVRLPAALAVFAVVLLATSSWAGTDKILYQFNNQGGAVPFSGMIFDAAGNLYGTTAYGGSGCNGGCGTVFELMPKTGGGW